MRAEFLLVMVSLSCTSMEASIARVPDEVTVSPMQVVFDVSTSDCASVELVAEGRAPLTDIGWQLDEGDTWALNVPWVDEIVYTDPLSIPLSWCPGPDPKPMLGTIYLFFEGVSPIIVPLDGMSEGSNAL